MPDGAPLSTSKGRGAKNVSTIFVVISRTCEKPGGLKKNKTKNSRVVWSHEETVILNLINTDEKNSGMPPFATKKNKKPMLPVPPSSATEFISLGMATLQISIFFFPDIS